MCDAAPKHQEELVKITHTSLEHHQKMLVQLETSKAFFESIRGLDDRVSCSFESLYVCAFLGLGRTFI